MGHVEGLDWGAVVAATSRGLETGKGRGFELLLFPSLSWIQAQGWMSPTDS